MTQAELSRDAEVPVPARVALIETQVGEVAVARTTTRGESCQSTCQVAHLESLDLVSQRVRELLR